jgi:hypothetical protein
MPAVCFRIYCGGPGFDIHDVRGGTKGTYYGDANYPACQCCDDGFEVSDAGPNRKFFVGKVCFCCCQNGYFPVPVWNGEKNEILRNNMHVTPCLKRFCPCICCCLRDFWVVEFPSHTTKIDKIELMAGGLLLDKQSKLI